VKHLAASAKAFAKPDILGWNKCFFSYILKAQASAKQ
jgi:hypothetical protein